MDFQGRVRRLTVEEEVLGRIKPTPDEERQIEGVVSVLAETLRKLIKERGLKAEPVLVGSVAKGTYLKRPDLDMFVMFEPDVPMDVVEREVLALGEAVLEAPERRFAQHPYLKGIFKGEDTEVVPCYRVEKASSKMSAVDRTPFHTTYVKGHLKSEQRDEVRLFKAFLKGIGIYGAEIAVEGFSGYLCEIMILKFGTFIGALKAAAGFDRKVRLRLDGRLRLDEEPFPTFQAPFVFIDPVDPARNVAAPVSEHSFSIFIHASRSYLAAPTDRFFFPRPVEVLPVDMIMDMVRGRGTEVVGIVLPVPEVVEDIYASQVTKAERAVCELLDRAGFPIVKGRSFVVDKPTEGSMGKALLVIETGVRELSATHIHHGPEVGHKNEKDFLETWKDHPRKAGRPHIKDRRWIVYVRREHRRPVEVVDAKFGSLNLGKQLNLAAKGNFRTLDLAGLAKGYAAQMSEFLDDRFSWER